LNEDEEIVESVQPSARLKAEVIAAIDKKIGIDAINVGELDLVLGISYLKELAKKQSFPFISANLVDEKDAPLFRRYVIKKVNGRNVGIFGVIGDTSDISAKVKAITKGAINVQDPLAAAKAVVKELKEKNVDYVIALTHQGINRDWVIARRVPGIDLVVGGHDKQKTQEPYEADKTLIVQAGEKGQYQGMLQVIMDGTRKAQNMLVPYGDDLQTDAAVKLMLVEYNDKLATMYGGSERKPGAANVALRLIACEACHGDQVAKWRSSDHAKAYDTLVKKSKQFDPNCLKCHTTRYNEPEGFNMKGQQQELVNIQCESCHGSAKDHLIDLSNKPTPKPAMAFCLKCHTADRCPGFDKNPQKMESIKHWASR
jgi:hypothetical protein